MYELRERRGIRVYPDEGEDEVIPVDQMSWNLNGLELPDLLRICFLASTCLTTLQALDE